MSEFKVQVQSLIDHIKTAVDVDPWAKEMVEALLRDKKPVQKVEFIESYIKVGDGDYNWNDNHGELIRCKNCKYRETVGQPGSRVQSCMLHHNIYTTDDWFCADGTKVDEE